MVSKIESTPATITGTLAGVIPTTLTSSSIRVGSHPPGIQKGEKLSEVELEMAGTDTPSEKPCEKRFTCSLCLEHHDIHIGSKTFTCKYCEKQFADKCSLILHEQIHTGEKLLKCKYCEKIFTRQDLLAPHEYTCIHAGEKSFECKCKYCEKKFNRRQYLVAHELVHTGEITFKCKFCEKRFSSKGRLDEHEYNHTREKPFRCKYCGITFTIWSNLTRHKCDQLHQMQVLVGKIR
jgi:uncharacterized Zn-finger protein